MRFTEFLLLEGFRNDVQIVSSIVSKSKTDRTLVTALRKWAKDRSTPSVIQIERGHPQVDVAGFYDPSQDEEGEIPVELTIQIPDVPLQSIAEELAIRFVTAIDHEWQHADQSRRRDHVPVRSVPMKFRSDRQKAYLANSDEIDTYALETAREWIRAEITSRDFKNFELLVKSSETLQLYVRVFGRSAKEIQKLLKRAVSYHEKEKE